MSKNKKQEQIKVFISYSHKDENWKDRFVEHLKGVVNEQQLDIWDDRRIIAGSDWQKHIIEALTTCNIAVLMISPSYLTSKFILVA